VKNKMYSVALSLRDTLNAMQNNIDKAPHDWLKHHSTDLIEAQNAWRDGTYLDESVGYYSMQYDQPFQIMCGVGIFAGHVRKFRFTPTIIASLGRRVDESGRNVFDESFLNHLQRFALRIEANMPAEGTLLLPNQPLAILKGSKIQILLLKSAIEELVGRSTYWATEAAMTRWAITDFDETETPHAPNTYANRMGWQIRANYIGGSITTGLGDELEVETLASNWTMYKRAEAAETTSQIRRLFAGNKPLADLALTESQDKSQSVSHKSVSFQAADKTNYRIGFSRFMRLYQPVLVKGHPVLASPQLAIRRQRALHQMAAFRHTGLSEYLTGKL
jgi:hypothetical protein